MFALLVFLAALGIEGIGTYISVIGLSAMFATNPIIIVLSIALDFAKVINVSFLYKYWDKISLPMKVYMTAAAIVLITITSTGAFGFLSGEFQKAIADTGTQEIKITTLEEEKGRLQKRKEEIDAQIAKLPDNSIRGRRQLIKEFGPEVSRLNDRLVEIDKELPDLKVKNVDKELHVGPIIYIAKAFNTTPEIAVKWVIMTIIFVFDPLAVALLIAGNFLIELRRKEKEAKNNPQVSAQVIEFLKKDEVPIDQEKLGEQLYEEHVSEEIAEDKQESVQLNVAEPNVEESVGELPHAVPARHIKVEERDGREIISFDAPAIAALDSVSLRLSDIVPEDSYHINQSKQTAKLKHHYGDFNYPEEPVKVGGPRG